MRKEDCAAVCAWEEGAAWDVAMLKENGAAVCAWEEGAATIAA